MNERLKPIQDAFPILSEDFHFMISTPEGSFDDPEDQVSVSVWGDRYKLEVSGPGELSHEFHDTQEQVIASLEKWLNAE
jgi:hypothetical protein